MCDLTRFFPNQIARKMSLTTISKLDCANKIKELTEEPSFACHKKQKLGTIENITEILIYFDH